MAPATILEIWNDDISGIDLSQYLEINLVFDSYCQQRANHITYCLVLLYIVNPTKHAVLWSSVYQLDWNLLGTST